MSELENCNNDERVYKCSDCNEWVESTEECCDNKDASDSEKEYEYTDYGATASYIVKIMVAGGGMGNGNAYAELEFHYDSEEDMINDPCEANEIYYCEYGNNPRRDLLPGNNIVWDEEGYNFNIE